MHATLADENVTDPTGPETLASRLETGSAGVPLRERYGLVLGLILGVYILADFDSNPLVRATTTILWVGILLASLWAPGVPRRVRTVGVIALTLILIMGISLGLIASDTALAYRLFLLAVAQLAAMLAIVSQVIRHHRVTLQTVMGGIAAYALLAFVMAAVYNGADILAQGAFLNGVADRGDYIYFSFVTMTTVGYGDITAATDFAKRLAVVEAFVGQVFIIVFVARLVSLWGKPSVPQ